MIRTQESRTKEIACSMIFVIRVLSSANRTWPSNIKIHGVLGINHIGILEKVPTERGISTDVWKDKNFVGGDIIDITEEIK